MPYAFDFAMSFSAGDRILAKKLSDLLEGKGARVFYDDFYRKHLFGKRLDKEFSSAFGEATRFFVPFVSSEYTQSAWPQYEWSVAKSENQQRREEFVLPLRVDDTLLLGLPDTVCYLDLREMELEEVADILMCKLEDSTAPIEIISKTREWVVTYGLLMEDLEEEELPANAPSKVPMLYDWLIEQLVNQLSSTVSPQIRVLEDARDGETLSVRLGFEWDMSDETLAFDDIGWWDILELAPYEDIYGPSSGVDEG